MLYSRTLLVIHFKYSSVYISIQNSLTIPSPYSSPLATRSSFSKDKTLALDWRNFKVWLWNECKEEWDLRLLLQYTTENNWIKSLILPYNLMSIILLMISVYIVKLFPMIWFQFLAFLRFGSRVEKLFPLKKLPFDISGHFYLKYCI